MLRATGKPSDSFNGDQFGRSLAISGETTIAGAPGDQGTGSGYVYVGVPTAVAATEISARRSGGSVKVSWRGMDPSVLGYHVYRMHSAKRVKLNPALILSRLGSNPAGHLYSWLDRTVPASGKLRYRLQAVKLDGTRSWVGATSVRR